MKCNINSVRTPNLFSNGLISFWAYPKAQTAPCDQKKEPSQIVADDFGGGLYEARKREILNMELLFRR